MGKRIRRRWDEERTDLLGQPELSVERGKGGPDYFYGWNQDPYVDACPLCGGQVIKMQDLFSRTYKDLIVENGKKRVISLEYGFHKWRCLDKNCRHIFAKEVGFASKYDNVTYRLEEEIAAKVMHGHTYGEIQNQLQGALSRQAVGQIFNRWVRKKEELRKLQSTPSRLGIISGKTEKERYVLFLNLDDGIRIFDVLYGINFSEIAAMIRKLDRAKIKTVLTDCEEIIVAAVRDYLPGAVHIIPVECWFELVKADFAAFAHEILRWSTVCEKDSLVMLSEAELGFRAMDLKELYRSKPKIKQPHKDYNRLRAIISNRDELWVFDELLEWIDSIDTAFCDYLSVTIMQLDHYRQEIENHVHYREEVPDRLFGMLGRMEEILEKTRIFSTEGIKAKVLYGAQIDLEHWIGIPIEDAIQSLTEQ